MGCAAGLGWASLRVRPCIFGRPRTGRVWRASRATTRRALASGQAALCLCPAWARPVLMESAGGRDGGRGSVEGGLPWRGWRARCALMEGATAMIGSRRRDGCAGGGWKAAVMYCVEVSCDGDVVLVGNGQSVVSLGNNRQIDRCVAGMIWITPLSPFLY